MRKIEKKIQDKKNKNIKRKLDEKKNDKNHLFKITIFLCLVFILGYVFSYIIINQLFIFDVIEVKMDVKVIDENIVGINTDADAIHFGKVQRGGEGLRYITLTNNDVKSHLIRIKTFGNISRFVSVSENNFIMEPNTTKNITVVVRPTLDCNIGYYEGVFQVMFINIF